MTGGHAVRLASYSSFKAAVKHRSLSNFSAKTMKKVGKHMFLGPFNDRSQPAGPIMTDFNLIALELEKSL